MELTRRQVADALEEIGMLLELSGENPFKCNAYAVAARAVARDHSDLEQLVAEGKLTRIEGIGKSTAVQITHLVREGRSPTLDDLRARFPESLRAMLGAIPGLGPKRLRVIHQKLGVASIADLEEAIHENQLLDLEGFGAKSQENLLAAITALRLTRGLFLLDRARLVTERLLPILREGYGPRVEPAGPYRRRCEVLDELVFVIETPGGQPPSEEEAGAEEGVRTRLVLRSPAAFGAALLWESSSEAHRESLARRALKRGFAFDSLGLRDAHGAVRPLDETEIYRALGLDPIPPVLREAPAEEVEVPSGELAGPHSIRGIFHVHTRDSDGTATLEEVLHEAERLGLEWIGISDHSQTPIYANGLTPERLLAQKRAIEEARERHPALTIFHGVESDILGDGELDYDDDLLAQLDFVVASIHSRFRMPEDEMTRRIERALRHPATTHWGHPTGRILLGREGYRCDVDHLLRVCAETGVSVEFNAHPNRLDLDWRKIPLARSLSVPISVNPDAHGLGGLSDSFRGVETAAKGGATGEDLLNSRSAEEVAAWLASRKQRTR
ncbi:MAG: helix-hairpin-helix domain-containing protein [Candidatus Eisenbacteria bacterium]|nr:helix-hairpin-helix domain-containing protein [Candidatus Eisenbacteria bacterium]